jgi:hypothetical protein
MSLAEVIAAFAWPDRVVIASELSNVTRLVVFSSPPVFHKATINAPQQLRPRQRRTGWTALKKLCKRRDSTPNDASWPWKAPHTAVSLQFRLALLFIACCLFASAGRLHAQVTFDWATVGNAGNGPDDTGFGAVSNVYRISKHEVTNAQYTEFLNAADPTGANAWALYNSLMSSNVNGGINFNSGAANGSKYQVKSGLDNNPVTFVSFFDAERVQDN